MKVDKADFVNMLSLLRPGLAKRDIVEQNVCFRFHPDKVVTYNDNVLVSIPFESGLEGGVRAEEIYKLVTKLTDDEINLSISTGELRLTCGKVEAGIALVDVSHPPISFDEQQQPLTLELLEAIKLTKFSVSTNMTYMRFTCIHVKDNTVTSSDGFRVSRVYLSENSPFAFLFPGFAAQFLDDYALSTIHVDSGWIHFGGERGITFSVRKINEEFFEEDKINNYLAVDGPSFAFPPQTGDILERCKIMVDQAVSFEMFVDIQVKDGIMSCRGEKTLGWVKEEISTDYSGDPFHIRINPLFLSDILSRTPSMIVGKDRCLFEADNFKHVMVLMGE